MDASAELGAAAICAQEVAKEQNEVTTPLSGADDSGASCVMEKPNLIVPDDLISFPLSPDSAPIKAQAVITSSQINSSTNLGALGVLSVYSSDSDESLEEFVSKVNSSFTRDQYPAPKITDKSYRLPSRRDSEESSSDDSENSSSTTSESSSTSDDDTALESDSERLPQARKKETAKPKPPRTDGELLLDDLPPIEDLKISIPEQECMEVGKVSAVVDRMVIVQAIKNTPALDLDSVLFLERGKRTLGRIFDVIGPVCEPAYCIRFNSSTHIQEKGIEKDMLVYCAPKMDHHTSFVFLGELLKMKGSDASWKSNNEPPAQLMDFSDDEEERKARRKKRSAQTDAGGPSTCEVVEPSSFEKRMNARNLARSQWPPSLRQQRGGGGFGRGAAASGGAGMPGLGRGSVSPGIVIQNYHSAPPPPLEPLSYQAPPPPRRPGYSVTRFQGQPTWPPQMNVMPVFPNAIPPPYQYGIGRGSALFSVPPPPMHRSVAPNIFSSPPPPPPPGTFTVPSPSLFSSNPFSPTTPNPFAPGSPFNRISNPFTHNTLNPYNPNSHNSYSPNPPF